MWTKLRAAALRLRLVLARRRLDSEAASELQSHLELLVARYIRSGMAPDEARLVATRQMGNVTLVREDIYTLNTVGWLEALAQDLRYAFRMIARNPGFAAVAILTLGLGIGANTAIFTVVNAVMLRPLPFKDADRLVRVVENVPAEESVNGAPRRIVGAMDVNELRELQSRARTLSHITAWAPTTMTATGLEEPVRLYGVRVSSAVFPMLGAQPALGRTFGAPEDASDVVVLSYSAWQQYFGLDPRILERRLTFDGKPYVVLGVMGAGFQFPDPQTQFWTPFVPTAFFDGAVNPRTPMMARLADHMSITAAADEVRAILHAVRSLPVPSNGAGPERFELVRAQDALVSQVKPALVVLTIAVGFVLLIACVNVANLLLARTAARQREIAIRIAIGAGRARVIRQLLTESLLLTCMAGVVGTIFAFGGIQLLRALGTSLSRADLGQVASFPRLTEIGLDARVFVFTAATSLATGVLFGLAPAMRYSRSDQMDVLRGAAESTPSGFRIFGSNVTQHLLVVTEIAMAMVLLVGAGLLIRSFTKLATVDAGFEPSDVLTFQVSVPRDLYPVARIKTFAEDLAGQLEAISGVRAVTYAHQLPMVQLQQSTLFKATPGPPKQRPRVPSPDLRLVSRDYFRVMGTSVIAGRGFAEADRAGQPGVVVINQALAERDFPGQKPIGHIVYIGVNPGPWEIVGVVANIRQIALEREPQPQFFIDFRQWKAESPVFDIPQYYAVRTSLSPQSLIPGIRRIVRQLDPNAALDNIATMQQLVSNSISRQRMYAVLLGTFAGIAVLLAGIGIYGVMAYSVTQRTREIGVRMALGAQRWDVMGLVLRQSVVLISAGIILGLSGSAVVTRHLQAMLFGLTPLDPTTFAAMAGLFAFVGVLASYVPARRATTVDPLVALRSE